MENITLEVLVNAGTAAILLFMYIRLEQRFDNLQTQLQETNMRLWTLLEKQLEMTGLAADDVKRLNPQPTPPRKT